MLATTEFLIFKYKEMPCCDFHKCFMEQAGPYSYLFYMRSGWRRDGP